MQGECNRCIALVALEMGIDQPKGIALAFIDRGIGITNLESREVAYLCRQCSDTLPRLDRIKD